MLSPIDTVVSPDVDLSLIVLGSLYNKTFTKKRYFMIYVKAYLQVGHVRLCHLAGLQQQIHHIIIIIIVIITGPTKLPCFQLQSGENVGRGK